LKQDEKMPGAQSVFLDLYTTCSNIAHRLWRSDARAAPVPGSLWDATLILVRRPSPSVNLSLGLTMPIGAIFLITLALGCASPGPPHPPSLHLPKPVNDLSVQRSGDHVELRFTAPARSTDNLALPAGAIHGVFCRQLEHKPCVTVGTPQAVMPSRPSARETVSWSDVLPTELMHGPAALLAYRVELFNAAGKSDGKSDAVYTVAGSAPEPVRNFSVKGSRLGVVLQWTPAQSSVGEVILSRENLDAAATPAKSAHAGATAANVTRLSVSAADAVRGEALDPTAKPETPYRYTAVRRLAVQLGGRTLEVNSAPTAPAAFLLHLVYPPLAPTALTAAGYVTDATATAQAGYAVDLIWQPVDDTGLLAGLAGYNVYRSGPAGRKKLNTTPVQVPAFNDATAHPTDRYSYSVTAVDGKGNESPAATVVLQPDAKP
jgi:hypothetical protein